LVFHSSTQAIIYLLKAGVSFLDNIASLKCTYSSQGTLLVQSSCV